MQSLIYYCKRIIFTPQSNLPPWSNYSQTPEHPYLTLLYHVLYGQKGQSRAVQSMDQLIAFFVKFYFIACLVDSCGHTKKADQ